MPSNYLGLLLHRVMSSTSDPISLGTPDELIDLDRVRRYLPKLRQRWIFLLKQSHNVLEGGSTMCSIRLNRS